MPFLHQTASRTRNTQSQNTEGASRSASPVGGLSYDEQMLQLKPASTVQRKETGGGLPEAIAALGLKKVTVRCSQADWDKLGVEAQDTLLQWLQAREEVIKKSKNFKHSTVRITSQKVIQKDDEELTGMEEQAASNLAALGANHGKRHAKGTLAVNRGEEHTEIEKLAQAKPVAGNFDATSTFASARYTPEQMQQSAAVQGLLMQVADKIKEIQAIDPNAVINVGAIASESYVTNPAGFEISGSLAAARAENAIIAAKAYFATDPEILDTIKINYTSDNRGANGPDWDGTKSKDDACYTDHQYVRLEVEMASTPPPETLTHTTQDAETVSVRTTTTFKNKPGGGGGGPGPGRKRPKAVKPKKASVKCPVF